MNKIKKQFVAFWQYFRLIRCGANTVEQSKRVRNWLPALIIMMIAIATVLAQTGISLSFYAEWFIGAAIAIGVITSDRPSALSVAPFSPRQRIIFTFLSTLLMALIFMAIILAAQMIFLCIIAFIAFCVDGENLFESAGNIEGYSAYGNAYIALIVLLFFFAAYAIFHLERGRNLTIATLVFFAVMEVLALVMTNICGNAAAVGITSPEYGYHFYGAAHVPEQIDGLALPWVPILVLCIADVSAIAAAVFMTVRRFKSDKV